MSKITPVLFTNLFPTRYEAQDNPGTICIFQADPDGTFYHCRRDWHKSELKDFIAPKLVELAVYQGPEGHFQVDRRDGGDNFWTDVAKSNVGPRYIGRLHTLIMAITFSCDYLGLQMDMDHYGEHMSMTWR